MSAALKCDRCGALSEHVAGAVRIDYHVTESVDSDGTPTQNSYELDLCPPCSKEFLAFAEPGNHQPEAT